MLKFSYRQQRRPNERFKIMSAAKSAKKAPVTISAPKIETAWKALCSTTSKNDATNRAAIERLANEVKASALSIRDAQKVIRETGIESSLVKVSHIEGLPTWLDLSIHADFIALDLNRQLSAAVAAYKLLGSGEAAKLPSFEAVTKATAERRKAKNSKPKSGESKSPKNPKVKSVRETLESILVFANSLDAESIGEADFDLLLEIAGVLEQKTMAGIDA